jgi:hypothetical protein
MPPDAPVITAVPLEFVEVISINLEFLNLPV